MNKKNWISKIKRFLIASLIFIGTTLASFIPIGIGLAIADIYLSGHGYIDLRTTQTFGGADWFNMIFIFSTLITGILSAGIYWYLSKPSEELASIENH